MVLPILRLVLIYFLLVAGVVAVFNRDKLAGLFPGGGRSEPAAQSQPVPVPAQPAPPLTSDPAEPGTAEAETATEGAVPVYPDPSMLGDPVAAAPEAPVVTPAPGIAPETPLLATTPQPHADAPVFPDESADPVPGSPGAPAPLGTPVAAAPETEPSPETEVEVPAPATQAAPAAPAAEPASEHAEAEPGAPATPARDASPDATIAQALSEVRTAYWAGDLDGAFARMTALADTHPDDANVLGELGNLAFALRDYATAADAWHKAGLVLIEAGEGARVMSFLPILQSLSPDKAAELAGRLQDR